MKFFEKIFSIKKELKYKIINILGLQFKVYTVKPQIEELYSLCFEARKILEELDPYVKLAKLKKSEINKPLIDVEIEKFQRKNILGTDSLSTDSPKLIVSLTSFPERMYDIHYAIFSLLNQSLKPYKVILWLSEEQFPNKENDLPKKLLNFKNYGLEINFTKDIRSYKKSIPTLKMYPDDILVTADDDIFYPKNWLELLYTDYQKHPDCILAHRVHKILFDENKKLLPFREWKRLINDGSSSLLNFPSTGGGVLYPPNSLYKDVLNEEIFTKLSKNSDEIWFWAMAILNKTKVKVAENAINTISIINAEREAFCANEIILARENSTTKNLKDKQINNLLEYYPELYNTLLKEWRNS